MKVVTQKFPRDAVTALEKGRKVEAVRLVRSVYGGKTRRAKQAVESYLERHPRVRNRMNTAQAENSLSGFNWLLIFAGVGAALYFFF